MYIIPCTSSTKGSCTDGITKTGCYLLKKDKGANVSDTDKLPSCFNVSLELLDSKGDFSSNITARECKNILGENYFQNSYSTGES